MKLTNITSLLRRIAPAAALTLMAGGLFTACDSVIYDDEGDCEPRYKVRFSYDYHLKNSNAFHNEVNAVTLYIVDPATGNIVWRKTDSSEAVRSENYTMDVEGIAPGRYKLLAWAGDGHNDSPHFTMGDGDHHTHLTATLNRNDANEVTDNLHRLYKDLDFEYNEREFSEEEGTHTHTVRLMKNTNDIHIVLQHLSGEPVNPEDYTFTIESPNGSMDYDNSILPDDTLTYRPWKQHAGLAEGYVPGNLEAAQFSAAIAHFSVGRMMADQKMWLNIHYTPKTRAGENQLVARVPVNDYALLVKGKYGDMPDQEYLDRQDDYSLLFFLDEKHHWSKIGIYINSWHVVPPQDTTIQ